MSNVNFDSLDAILLRNVTAKGLQTLVEFAIDN